MTRYQTPISYAENACETMMRKFKAAELPPKGHFHYHQGVFLSGMHHTYQLTDREAYFCYIKDWVDSVIDAEGRILDYTHGELDDIQPGILLFPLWDKTGDSRYRKGLQSVLQQVEDIPRNKLGGYWHKPYLEDQMWLDGLYMAGPFCAEYGRRFDHPELFRQVIAQALLMREKTIDEESGLLYHAWDGSGKEDWADPQTGRSPEFWGRSIGWVPVALLDDLDHIAEDEAGRKDLLQMATELLAAVCRFQSDDGRWYQVVNKPEEAGNWLENSCTCLFVAALCKAVRKGFMRPEYAVQAHRGFDGVIRSLEWAGEDVQIGNVCIGTGVGDYQHYCNRPVSVNDLHGVGAFLLMCCEAQRLINAGMSW